MDTLKIVLQHKSTKHFLYQIYVFILYPKKRGIIFRIKKEF